MSISEDFEEGSRTRHLDDESFSWLAVRVLVDIETLHHKAKARGRERLRLLNQRSCQTFAMPPKA